jgi:hypothetical protein
MKRLPLIITVFSSLWLEPVPPSHIESLKIVPDVDQGCVRIKVAAVAGKDDGNLPKNP